MDPKTDEATSLSGESGGSMEGTEGEVNLALEEHSIITRSKPSVAKRGGGITLK